MKGLSAPRSMGSSVSRERQLARAGASVLPLAVDSQRAYEAISALGEDTTH